MFTLGNTPPPQAVLTVTADAIAFDGHRFARNMDLVPWLYIARQARQGDTKAAALLTAWHCECVSLDGVVYWPTEERGVER